MPAGTAVGRGRVERADARGGEAARSEEGEQVEERGDGPVDLVDVTIENGPRRVTGLGHVRLVDQDDAVAAAPAVGAYQVQHADEGGDVVPSVGERRQERAGGLDVIQELAGRK